MSSQFVNNKGKPGRKSSYFFTEWLRRGHDVSNVFSAMFTFCMNFMHFLDFCIRAMSYNQGASMNTMTTKRNANGHFNQIQLNESDNEENSPPVNFSSVTSNNKKTSMKGSIITTGLLILCYFTLSIGLTFYQRWLLKVC